jgi:hypothetical protein
LYLTAAFTALRNTLYPHIINYFNMTTSALSHYLCSAALAAERMMLLSRVISSCCCSYALYTGTKNG